MIHSLRRTSHNTYNLLENLLDWSRIHRGTIAYEPQDIALREIVDHVFRILESRAATKSQSLINEVEPKTTVYTDKNIVSALLINMVNNGIKFTPQNGSVRVFTLPQNEKLKICVEDTGMGIEEEDIPKLFRIDVSCQRKGTENEPGTGLGLIMCKEYLNLMGETISVSSRVGQGTTISFTVTPR
jgi:signal transduction histidine kinase